MSLNEVENLPPFNEKGCLPPGQYQLSSWEELVNRFGNTKRRRKLLEGLKKALLNLQQAGCQTVYLGGSFVTTKPKPNDYDGCWNVEGVNYDRVDPVLRDTTEEGCLKQKQIYGGELVTTITLPQGIGYNGEDDSFINMVNFYQSQDQQGYCKGVVVINLQQLNLNQ